VVLDPVIGWAELCGDPPIPEAILQCLAIAPDDERLMQHEPFEMK
jgi:hypothetical protein